MDAGPGQAMPAASPALTMPPPVMPPPSAPPALPPTAGRPPDYGYVIPVQATRPAYTLPVGYAQPPARSTVPVRRSLVLAWAAASVAVVVVCLPMLVSMTRQPGGDSSGLHAVAGISSAPWSAEFVDASGLPARWDPCTAVHYVIDPAGAPAAGPADVQQAFARLGAATGMTFVEDGTTTERPSRARSAYQPSAYGRVWAPILVSWSTPGETDLLDDPKSEAVTVPVAVNSASNTGGGSIVSAEVVLNIDRQLPVGFGPGPSEGEVLMHELGHAVGLGHVDSRADAMYPTVRGIAAYGPGDLAGFAAVGMAAGCHAAPSPHGLDILQIPQG